MPDYLEFTGPGALKTRGTVIVIPGRGESATTYRRFASRIAADSYLVRVLSEPPRTASADESTAELSAALTDVVSEWGDDIARPLVLVGSDLGAAALSALHSRAGSDESWWPDALVLAALPGFGWQVIDDDWQSELEARTNCPVHRAVLSDDAQARPGALAGALDSDLLDRAYDNTTDVATLVLVGDEDRFADLHALHSFAKGLPLARLSIVHGAHHDVLNDVQHRSVAAEVITFLEIVRNGRPLLPVVSSSSSGW